MPRAAALLHRRAALGVSLDVEPRHLLLVVLRYLDKPRAFTVCPMCGNPVLLRQASGHLLHTR